MNQTPPLSNATLDTLRDDALMEAEFTGKGKVEIGRF